MTLLGLNSTNDYKVPVTMWQPMLRQSILITQDSVTVDLVADYDRKRKLQLVTGAMGQPAASKKKKTTKTLDSFFAKKVDKVDKKDALVALTKQEELEKNGLRYIRELCKAYDYDFGLVLKEALPYFEGGPSNKFLKSWGGK